MMMPVPVSQFFLQRCSADGVLDGDRRNVSLRYQSGTNVISMSGQENGFFGRSSFRQSLIEHGRRTPPHWCRNPQWPPESPPGHRGPYAAR